MNLSLQGKLIAVTILFLAIISVCLGFLSYSQLESSREKSIQSQAEAQAQAFTQYLSSWAFDRQQIMSVLAGELEHSLSQRGKLDHPQVLKWLNQAKNSGGFALTFVGLEDGTMYRHDPSLDKSGYDPRVRGWYKSAKELQRPFTTVPYIAATGKKFAITFVVPLMVNGQFVGAIGGLFYMDKIIQQVLSQKVQGDGYAMLLDKRNVIAAFPNQSMILKHPTVLNFKLTSDELSHLGELHTVQKLSVDGHKTLLYLGNIPNTQWVLGLVMKESVLNAPLHQLLWKTILVSFLILIVIIIGAVFLIRWIFKDLRLVSSGLANITSGNGDLTRRIETQSTDEIGMLAQNFNSFVEYLHDIIDGVRDIGNSLVQQASTTQQISAESASRINNQQQEITLVATAVNEMTVATQEIANNAANTAQISDEAVNQSNDGEIQLHQSQESIVKLADEIQNTTDAIGKLDGHVQEIGSIVSTITAIAEQTNLLALNAAIEAARAGEQGRGFAVVADEVRSLSQRTHSSTEEIRNMIQLLQEATQHAVASMDSSQELAQKSVLDTNDANQSFTRIRQSIESINEMATQIATAAEEQTSVTAEINENTTNIHSASEQLADSVSTSANQSEELSRLSERLKESIGVFKL
ncbi:MAG: Methyl-accepting chemotaxis protein McpA [Candidatus Celerinatantimonas neptuna]|nr:MAG: Methyl-accepting chemotaxis protein McpA [Candidatus Celerinatantimonas neptuna]